MGDRRVEAAARAIHAAEDKQYAFDDRSMYDQESYRALARAALAAAPSALDRLAAWADAHRRHTLSVYRHSPTAMCVEVITGPLIAVQELDADVQVAAERVLARLEEGKDG